MPLLALGSTLSLETTSLESAGATLIVKGVRTGEPSVWLLWGYGLKYLSLFSLRGTEHVHNYGLLVYK